MAKTQLKPTTELVIFNGIRFYRYPKSTNKDVRTYFRPSKEVRQKKRVGALHREVWKFHNGEIPKGFHVHHKDHNTANNDISNLELISEIEHGYLHCQDEKWREEYDRRTIKKRHPKGKKCPTN